MRCVIALMVTLITYNQLFSEQQLGSIKISVHDSRTARPVSGATVQVGTMHQHTVENGTCVIDSLIPGLYTVIVIASQYDTLIEPTVQVHTGMNPVLLVSIHRRSDVQDLDKMVIVGKSLALRKPGQTTSVTRINSYEIANTPGTANDINRVLSSHPAVVTSLGADFDNSLYVRGGHSYENVYVIDGIEMENANHFSSVERSGGAIGFINTLLVRDLEFYVGGFPAALPSRLSSVIDVHLRNGSSEKTHLELDLNVTGLGLTVEGPVTKYASYLANIRFADFSILKPLLTTEGMPSFGDAVFKTVITPDESNLFRITAIGALDKYVEEYDTEDYPVVTTYDQFIVQAGGIGAWEFNNGTVKNELSISGSLRDLKDSDNVYNFSDTVKLDTFYYNVSQYKRDYTIHDTLVQPTDTMYMQARAYVRKVIRGSDDHRWRASLNDNFTLFLREKDQLNLGFSASNYRYTIGQESGYASNSYMYYMQDNRPVIIPEQAWSRRPFRVDSTIDVRQFSGYAEYIYSEEPFKVVAGLRGDYFTVMTDYGISPRLGLRMDSKWGTISFSSGLQYQFPAEFTGLIEDILAVDPNENFLNKAPVEDSRLQRCWEAALGYDKKFAGDHLLTIETYFKWYDREYPLVAPGERQYIKYTSESTRWMLDNPTGKKRAYGIECSFQKKKYDHLLYALSGSVFDVKNRYTDNKWYNDENNVRGTLGLTVGTNFRKHGISLRASASGGRPYTPVSYDKQSGFYHLDSTKDYYEASLDPLLTLNLRYTFKLYPRWGSILGYFELWNLLNYTPVVERYFSPWTGYNDFRSNGILPIGGITVHF